MLMRRTVNASVHRATLACWTPRNVFSSEHQSTGEEEAALDTPFTVYDYTCIS